MRKHIYFTSVKLKSIIIMFLSAFFFLGILFVFEKTKAADNAEIKVPIIMYHSVLKDTSKSGRYTITPTQLEDDLKYIVENGYTTVFIDDIIRYVYNNKPLPAKPIILTFDDGHYNNKTYLLPLLEKYNQKAAVSVVGKYTDTYSEAPDENPNYAYLSWKNLNELISSGRVEIGNHSYNMHSLSQRKGTHKIDGESFEAYAHSLTADVMKMQALCAAQLGSAPDFFTYPFGSVSDESVEILKNCGFRATLSCSEGINSLTRNPDELFLLKRCIRTNTRSLRDILD